MATGVSEESMSNTAETQSMKNCDSVENFQKFIYQLFEKNGILNDLRAYLRGHIVDVLKSAQTGNPPPCQKHFTQRLDLTFQSLNVLVAEYLMRLEFSYSFSVFISEIPLANMVFGFARTLIQSSSGNSRDLTFSNDDIWSILNYLGIQCDSDHASNIVDTYREGSTPLLLCILKCMPMYRKEPAKQELPNSSEDSLSSGKSSDTVENKCLPKEGSSHDKCKHYAFCKTCQNRITKIKEKYKKKKKHLAKSIKGTSANPFSVETLMRNVNVMERSLIDEMFEQLKTVYEAEVEMLKAEEDKRVKRSLVSHAAQLQKRKDEMEASFRARESVLEQNIQQKKRFLWGLARSLREQHARLARAMQDLQAESSRLCDKEESLKSQLAEAENVLRKRGEDMRCQITHELTILEGHLASMKRERDGINKERIQLELMKTDVTTTSETEHSDLHAHYDLLKNELGILKKYLETSKLAPKCVIDRGTVTELSDVTSNISVVLNNRQGFSRNSDSSERLRNKQLVNDLKKQKNVNFSQSNLDELYRERSRDRSRSSASSEAGDAAEIELNVERNRDYDRDVLQRLTEENERLKTFARQQRDHIDELSSTQARLQAELTSVRFRSMESATLRPRTAPTVMPPNPTYFVPSVNTSASANTVSLSWCKGGGEELSLFSNAQPRILIPGDTLPFIGVLRDRQSDNRRHLINQWRALRRRTSPLGGVSKPRVSPRDRNIHHIIRTDTTSVPDHAQASCSEHTNNEPTNNDDIFQFQSMKEQRPKTSERLSIHRNREKSPKSVLREAKEKLRTKDSIKDPAPTVSRDRSPNSVLREAKLRLRKLEIEAEAVEKSYLDFRKRQSELREERRAIELAKNDFMVDKDVRDLDMKSSRSLQKLDKTIKNNIDVKCKDVEQSFQTDLDKYLREYQHKFNFAETHFRNRTTAANVIKPIPRAYSKTDETVKEKERENNNLLETPMTEFRKLYKSERKLKIEDSPQKLDDDNVKANLSAQTLGSKKKRTKNAELEILKQNINKIYYFPENAVEKTAKAKETPKTDENLLRVEIEGANGLNDAKSPGVSLLVESFANMSVSEISKKTSPHMTIIISPKKDSPETGLSESPKNKDEMDYKSTENHGNNNTEQFFKSIGDSPKNPTINRNIPKSPDATKIDINPKKLISKSPTRVRNITSPKSSDDSKVSDCIEINISPFPKQKRSVSPEQAAHLTRNDVLDAIFNEKQASSIHMGEEKSSQEVLEEFPSDFEKGDDYVDDFSADVDNYNSRSDVNDTNISLPKTSEDENFWDS